MRANAGPVEGALIRTVPSSILCSGWLSDASPLSRTDVVPHATTDCGADWGSDTVRVAFTDGIPKLLLR